MKQREEVFEEWLAHCRAVGFNHGQKLFDMLLDWGQGRFFVDSADADSLLRRAEEGGVIRRAGGKLEPRFEQRVAGIGGGRWDPKGFPYPHLCGWQPVPSGIKSRMAIRKRSELKAAAPPEVVPSPTPPPPAVPPVARGKATPKDVPHAWCGVCGLPLRDPFGTGTFGCANSHAGAPVVSEAEAAAIRARDLGQEPTSAPAAPDKSRLLSEPQRVNPEDTSVALKEEMRRAEEAEANRAAADFARSLPKETPPREPWPQLVETVFAPIDVMEAYKHLQKALVIGEQRAEYGVALKHLDEAEDNARLAHRLMLVAKAEHKAWELDNAVIFGAMRKEAERVLSQEKKDGLRTKQITDGDVEAQIAVMFGDEYKLNEMRRYKMRKMIESLENLVEICNSRCRSLQVIVGKQR
jgi:uncharacterized Zn finger protein (UPF0148 family)